MGPRGKPQCLFCKHFRIDPARPLGRTTCNAFPYGIPEDVYTNLWDHRHPFAGDHGILFEKLPTSELRKRWFWAGRTPEQVDEIYEITLRFLDDFFPRYDEFRRMNTIYLSIGSNTDPETNLREMVRLLREKSAVLDVSPVYESADSSGGDMVYLNAAVLLQTPYDPEAFKEGVLVTIEDRLERESSGPFVTADLDIVLVNEDVLEYLGRQIPDPGILKHAFIARPLADIAPAYTHPVTGQTLREIADAIEDATITRRDDITL